MFLTTGCATQKYAWNGYDDSEWIDLALTEDYVQLFNEQNLLSTILSNKLKNGKDGGLLADQRYAMKYYYGQFFANT